MMNYEKGQSGGSGCLVKAGNLCHNPEIPFCCGLYSAEWLQLMFAYVFAAVAVRRSILV